MKAARDLRCPAGTFPANFPALCPAHADKNPSLSISERDGKILVHCHAGCSQEAVCAALKTEARKLFPQNGNDGPNGAKGKICRNLRLSD